MPLLIWILLGGGVFYVATKAKPSQGSTQGRSVAAGGGPRVQVSSVARPKMRIHAAKGSQVWLGKQRQTGAEGNIAEAERAIDQLANKINETSNPIERQKFLRAYAHLSNWRARIKGEDAPYGYVDTLLDPAIDDTQPADWKASARTRIEASHQARFTTLDARISNPCLSAWGELDPVAAALPKNISARGPVPTRGVTPGTGSNVVMETVYSFFRGLKNIWTQGIRNTQYRGEQGGNASPIGPTETPFGYNWSSTNGYLQPPAGGRIQTAGAATDESESQEPNIRGTNS